MAQVAETKWLWDARAGLTMCHLLGTLRGIHTLLWSFHCDLGGPGAHVVAEHCQRAIKGIRGCCSDSEVTIVMSSGQ